MLPECEWLAGSLLKPTEQNYIEEMYNRQVNENCIVYMLIQSNNYNLPRC